MLAFEKGSPSRGLPPGFRTDRREDSFEGLDRLMSRKSVSEASTTESEQESSKESKNTPANVTNLKSAALVDYEESSCLSGQESWAPTKVRGVCKCSRGDFF
jgi:hypothetical protein